MKLNENLINGIVKYINTMYSPKRIDVSNSESNYLIEIYFDHIDDSYISNPRHHSTNSLKARNFENKLRKDIYNFFGVMTSGLSFEGHAPYVPQDLKIKVILE
jgi:hypothetical protein